MGESRIFRRHWAAAFSLFLAACGGGGGSTVTADPTTPPGTPQFTITDATAAEGNSGTTALTFTVFLSPASAATVTVDYATADDTATAGSDYTAASGTLTFPAGATSRTITVNASGDLVSEANETFRVLLSNATGGAGIADGTGLGTISNDDSLPALGIADASTAEGDAGSHPLTFTLTLAPASTGTVTVQYATANGSATAGSDYTATSGTVTFTPGVTTQDVTVNVLGDTDAEVNESFAVVLSNPSGAVITDNQASGTITNDDGSAAFGLDARPANAACVAPPRPTGGAGVETVPFSDFSFTQPTKSLQAPGDPTHWYVLEKGGRVKRFDVASPSTVTTFLDISARVDARGEGGLLGMAFHPDFPGTQEVFISYTTPGTGGYEMVSRIARLKLDGSTNPPEEILLTLNQPLIYHKGGDIAFGPDGFLYIGFGDGATALANGDAQNLQKLLGKMLRIDVAGVAWPSPGYNIPNDNPYHGNARCGTNGGSGAAPCAEIYAYGLRNPWRWSFDRDTGRLWLADVGETHYEEVDIVTKGGNYGWPEREGLHCTPELYPGGTGCKTVNNGDVMIDPVVEYSHDGTNIAATGGFVYRGSVIPELQGKYVFGDFSSGNLWSVTDNGDGSFTRTFLFLEGHLVTSFALGADGELYFTDYGGGSTNGGIVRKLVPKAGGTPDTIPTNLVDTGCVDPLDPSQPAPGMIPYGINAPFWSDGVQKERWLAIPDGTTISVNAANDWNLPPGSVLMKLFRLNGNPIETRLLMRHPDGEWRGYTWEWNGGVATRLKDGKTKTIDGQSWTYPTESQCLRCHTAAAGYSLGPETAQLNGNFTYPSTGRTANQLATLDHIGLFTSPIGDPAALPALPSPTDSSQSLDARARSWLHTNCSGCHRPGGPTPSVMDLRYTTTLVNTGACNATPASGNLGLTNPKLIKPGDAANSLVRERMSRRDAFGMPPLGSAIPDAAAVTLITDWINSLSGCN